MRHSFILFYCYFALFIHKTQGKNTFWPLPAEVYGSVERYELDKSSFKLTATSATNSVLQNAFVRYRSRFFQDNYIPTNQPPASTNSPKSKAPLKSLLGLDVLVFSDISQIQYGVSESYTLDTNPQPNGNAILVADTVFGALRGLETFSQAMRYDGKTFTVDGWIIQDQPRFKWRGLLLDTSRHFYPVQTILRQLDAMEMVKLNTFHWHAVDGQSFPVESKVFPDLSGKGAYSPSMVYSQSDIKKIVSYANERGIRVVPEFDMPAHATSWGFGYPWLVMNCTMFSSKCKPDPPQAPRNFGDACGDDPFDPINPNTYTFIDKFLGEMSTLFPDNYLHLGGDELSYREDCWNTTKINDWKKKNGILTWEQVEGYFVKKTQGIAQKYNKIIVNWQEIFNNGIEIMSGGIVQVWKDHKTLDSVVKAGIRGTLSFDWYLNYAISWETMYNNEPDDGTLTQIERDLIIGGEGCMWSENADETNVEPTIWPRALAIAERLWSPSFVNSTTEAFPRYHFHRCLMKGRGVLISPVGIGYCWGTNF